MNDKQLDDFLNKEIGKLDRDITPARDLWPGIDHAINHHNADYYRPIAIAASILLLISVAVSGGLYYQRPSQGQQAIPADFISLLQNDHARNKQALMVEYQGQPALAPDWEEQMRQLEQAEQAIYEALTEDPDNLELLKILRQVQTKQIELIESVYAPLFTTI